MNRRFFKWGLVLSLVLSFLAGCASTKKVEEKTVEKTQAKTEAKTEAKVEEKVETMLLPQWMTAPPQDEKHFYGVATATSKDLQLALDKASTDARVEIGNQVEIRIQGLLKKFKEEIGHGEDAQLTELATKTVKQVVSNSLSGSRIKEQKFLREGGVYRAYSLVEYSTGAANQELLNQIKSQKEMYTRFLDSKAFKELDDETKRYEEWKKQQAQ